MRWRRQMRYVSYQTTSPRSRVGPSRRPGISFAEPNQQNDMRLHFFFLTSAASKALAPCETVQAMQTTWCTLIDSRRRIALALRRNSAPRANVILALCALSPLWVPCPSSAADKAVWVPSPLHATDSSTQDLELTLRARQALQASLQDDAQGVGVSVHNRVATLWGSVPSAEVAQRAEERVRRVIGLIGIHNQLQIQPAVGSNRTHALPPDRMNAVTTRVTSRDKSDKSPIAAKPELSATVPNGKPKQQDTNGLRQPDGNAAEISVVMPALSLPGPPKGSTGLTQAVESLRLSDERFRGIRPEVIDGIVYLRGTVYRMDHLFELARSVSRLPGVRRVVLDDVHEE